MEQKIFEMIVESMPFMGGFIALGVIVGFVVFLCMKFYNRVENGFDKIEMKTTSLGNSLAKVEVDVANLKAWTQAADIRFNKIEVRLERVEVRLDNLEIRMERVETKLDRMEEKFDRKFDTIITLLLSKKAETADS